MKYTNLLRGGKTLSDEFLNATRIAEEPAAIVALRESLGQHTSPEVAPNVRRSMRRSSDRIERRLYTIFRLPPSPALLLFYWDNTLGSGGEIIYHRNPKRKRGNQCCRFSLAYASGYDAHTSPKYDAHTSPKQAE